MIFCIPVFVMVERVEKNELGSVRCGGDEKSVCKDGVLCISHRLQRGG